VLKESPHVCGHVHNGRSKALSLGQTRQIGPRSYADQAFCMHFLLDASKILSADDKFVAALAYKSESSCANPGHCQSASLTLPNTRSLAFPPTFPTRPGQLLLLLNVKTSFRAETVARRVDIGPEQSI
jgi:hypothetical protein